MVLFSYARKLGDLGVEPRTYSLLTTSAFAAISVCGLDHAIIPLGYEPSDLYTFSKAKALHLARRCLAFAGGSPNLARVHLQIAL